MSCNKNNEKNNKKMRFLKMMDQLSTNHIHKRMKYEIQATWKEKAQNKQNMQLNVEVRGQQTGDIGTYVYVLIDRSDTRTLTDTWKWYKKLKWYIKVI